MGRNINLLLGKLLTFLHNNPRYIEQHENVNAGLFFIDERDWALN